MTQAAVTTSPITTAAEVLGPVSGQQEPPQTSSVDDKLSPKFQALLKRERVAIDRERAAKELEMGVETRSKSLADRESKIAEFESLKTKNPLKALEMLGLSYQQLTDIALADGNIPPELEVKRVEEKFDSYLRSQEENEKKRIEAEHKSAQDREVQITQKFKGEISTYVKDNSDRYELINFEQNDDLVYDVIDAHYERTKNEETGLGEVMTIAQAADKVEEYLEKKYDKARELKKMKALWERSSKPAPKQDFLEKLKNTETRQTPKTLTNNLSATPSPSKSTAPITDEERIRRAIAYAKGIRP